MAYSVPFSKEIKLAILKNGYFEYPQKTLLGEKEPLYIVPQTVYSLQQKKTYEFSLFGSGEIAGKGVYSAKELETSLTEIGDKKNIMVFDAVHREKLSFLEFFKDETIENEKRGSFDITIHGEEIKNLLFLDKKEIRDVTANISYWHDDTLTSSTDSIKIGVCNLSFLDHNGEQTDGLPYTWMEDIQNQIKSIAKMNINHLLSKQQGDIFLVADELKIPSAPQSGYLVESKNNSGYHTTDEGNMILNSKLTIASIANKYDEGSGTLGDITRSCGTAKIVELN